jgi:hypothetical protein
MSGPASAFHRRAPAATPTATNHPAAKSPKLRLAASDRPLAAGAVSEDIRETEDQTLPMESGRTWIEKIARHFDNSSEEYDAYTDRRISWWVESNTFSLSMTLDRKTRGRPAAVSMGPRDLGRESGARRLGRGGHGASEGGDGSPASSLGVGTAPE